MRGLRFWRRRRRSRVLRPANERLANFPFVPRTPAKQSRDTGTPPDGGSLKLSASIIEREHGTRTPGTGTTVASSFYSQPGVAWVAFFAPTWQPLVSSYFEPGAYTSATAILGVSGEPQGRVV